MANHPPPEKVATIIVSRPGVIRQALRTMLAVLPQIEITAAVGGGLSALNLVRQNRPALLVIDTSLPEDEILALRRQTKEEQPLVRCLVVAKASRQQAAVLAQGADATIFAQRTRRTAGRGAGKDHALVGSSRPF